MKEVQKMKQYYITELHMGDDGLESYTDHSGPFTLNKARKIMERLMKGNDPWVNPYAMTIRGPRHMNGYGHNTEFYSHKEMA
jgi:benzoyl-CoA reductase/2-hydroxyglutaryl-CoA dehydratase subunit BcrC/BadD/HgdB|tara:strand:- start:587 stop:832 length:246 start_codon:yes stop_codon:yes gene_type:complete